jgi:protein SCO1/2
MGNGAMKRGSVARNSRRDRKAVVLACGSVAAILVCASLLLWLASAGRQSRQSAQTIGGPFSLVDDRGNPVTERSFPGKYLVVYFGYTACPDICPATLNTLAASLDRLGRKADHVQPLFVTIDPGHDTPAVLHRYVGAFSPRLVGVSGPGAQLASVADEYKVIRTRHISPETRSPPALDHSAVLYLMAPDGTFIAPIPADASEMVMAEAIGRYVL